MYKKIDKDNEIFKSHYFLKDKYKFYIVLKILEGENPIIYSNERDYFLIRTDSSHPIWIWNKDEIGKEEISEIKEVILFLTKESTNTSITCKKELYDRLIENKFDIINKDDYFEMGSLHCTKLIEPKSILNKMVQAKESDVDVLTNYWYLDNLEVGDKNITLKKAKEDVISMINSGNTYVLKNQNLKIVSMASYTRTNDVARINHVYTPKEERNNGYCANIIYKLSKKLLDNRIVPMLYTDYNYVPSNKSYINVGYEKDGILINFSCIKK